MISRLRLLSNNTLIIDFLHKLVEKLVTYGCISNIFYSKVFSFPIELQEPDVIGSIKPNLK